MSYSEIIASCHLYLFISAVIEIKINVYSNGGVLQSPGLFFKARNTSESKNRLNAVLRLTISAFTWMLRCD